MAATTLPATPAERIRATALPLPEVTVTEELVPTGGMFTVRVIKLRKVLVADAVLLRDGAGKLYSSCWKCPQESGYLHEFAGLDGGRCYACMGRGIKLYADDIEGAQRKVRSAQAAELRAQAKAARMVEEDRLYVEAQMPVWHAEALAEDARREAEKAEKAAKEAELRHIGQAKERVTVTGTVQVAMVIDQDSQWGSRMLVVVKGEGEHEGVTLKTTGTASDLWGLERGQKVTMTGTVKEHTTYADKRLGLTVPQTVVIRVKVA